MKEYNMTMKNDLIIEETDYFIHQLKVEFLNIKNFCYIVVDKYSREAAVIDPAWDIGQISEKLESHDIKLSSVLLTHSHYDHTNLANALAKRYTCNVFMSREEINFYGFKCLRLNSLKDNDSVQIGNIVISCMLTPGHTFGSSCYILNGSIFTGDTVFIEGCGVCTGKGASAEQMYYSIQKVKNSLKDDIKVYPGHSFGKMPGHSLSYLAKENIYFQIDRKDIFIKYRMRPNQKSIFSFK